MNLLIILSSLEGVFSRFNINSDLVNWFGAITENLCPSDHIQLMGLEPHQCVSYSFTCMNTKGVEIRQKNGVQLLCHEQLQFFQLLEMFSNSQIIVTSFNPLSIDFTIDGQITYQTAGLLQPTCSFGFYWMNSQNIKKVECLFCYFKQFGKNCASQPDGTSSVTSVSNQYKTSYTVEFCTNKNCSKCNSNDLNTCVSGQCVNYFYGQNCGFQCQLGCSQETCLCNTADGTFIRCKYGFIEEDINSVKNCVQKCSQYCSSCILNANSEYVCTNCYYEQNYGSQYFIQRVVVNNKCEGIQNCLEYIITKDDQGFETMTCFYCFPGSYLSLDQKQCKSCLDQISNCLFCTKQEPTNCIACKRRYYLDRYGNCKPSVTKCGPSCYICTAFDKDFCTVCQHSEMIVNYFGNCVCQDGYYASGNDINPCTQCNSLCTTCIGGTISDCTSCNQLAQRTLINGQCNCILGYGKVDEVQFECMTCHQKCRTCEFSNNPLSCTSCNEEQFRELSDNLECICKIGYDDSQGAPDVCYQCHYSCRSCNGQTENDCLTCQSEALRTITINNQCKCNKGYVDCIDLVQCQRCHHSCIDCLYNTNEDSCTECSNTRIPEFNNQTFKCICQEPNYFDDGLNQECQQCHYSCMTCDGYENYNCLSCDSNYRKQINFNCECYDYYYDVGQKICSQCHYSCQTCSDNQIQSCQTCSLDKDFRYFSEGKCLCIDGYYDDGQQSSCLKCSYKCKTCQNKEDNCIECALNSYRDLGQDFLCSCPSYFLEAFDQPKCQKCNFKCLNCNGTEEFNCTECDDLNNRYLLNSQCLCKIHYFELELENCQICSQYCNGCDNIYDNCTSCQLDRFLSGNKCICATKQNGLSISTYDYLGEVQCKKCHYSCLICNGPAQQHCLTCLESEQRYLLNGKCVCQVGYVDVGTPQCQQCNYNCLNCIFQPKSCTSCQSNSFRKLNNQIKSCQCLNGYYDDGSNPICQQCNYTCGECSTLSTNCLACPLNSFRTYNSILFQCNCNAYYYDNGDVVCDKCHYTCKLCNGNDKINCTQCASTITTFRYLNNNQCLCIDGYFDNGSENCNLCQIQCLTCLNYAFQCQSCVQTRELLNNDCVCKQGYFEQGNKDCLQCHSNCLECKTSSTNCIACNILIFRILNIYYSKCDCMEGYIEINGACEKCYHQCQTCITSQNQCQTCPLNRYQVGITCLCYEGYFDNGKDCQQCHSTCLTCKFFSQFCFTCSLSNYRIFSSYSCICQDGYFENLQNTNCEKCSPICLTCTSTSTFCLSCKTNQELDLVKNTCVCQKGYYYDDAYNNCQKCHISCLDCESYWNCINCSPQSRQFDENNQKCNCQQGYYEANQPQCNKCNYQCQTCINDSFNCLSCNEAYNRELDKNYCKCHFGFYDIGIEICQPCSNVCQSCFLSSTQCLSCYENQYRILQSNSCICKDGYFDSGSNICKQCSKSCKTCIQTEKKCTSCDIDQKRFDQSSISKCPCILGYYEDKNELCQKCNYKCETCINESDKCLSCSKALNSFRQSISYNCNCRAGYYDDGINVVCQKCDLQCKNCQNQSHYCIECVNELRSNPPLCQCIQGYFENENKNCLKCENQCQTCIYNQSNCLSCKTGRIGNDCICKDGFYEAGLESCQPCQNQCKTCQLADFCFSCKGDRINLPFCLCQEGYYDDNINENCQECDYTCKSCTILGCTSCNGNRILSSEMICEPPVGSISYQNTPWCSNCYVAVIKVAFSNDLSQIIIKFDFPLKTFKNNNFNNNLCNLTFGQNTLTKLGKKYNCQISELDQSLFIIYLDYISEITVGDSVEINKNVLSHINCESKLDMFIFTKIQLPSNPFPPLIQFDLPDKDLSPCLENSILQNLTQNDGKRQFMNVYWSYIIEKDERSDKLDSLVEDLNNFQLLDIFIPSVTLPAAKSIYFYLSITSFVNITSNFSIFIKTGDISEPTIQIETKNKYFIYEKISLNFLFSSSINCLLAKNQDNQTHYYLTMFEVKINNTHAKSSSLALSTEVFTNEYQLLILEYTLSPETEYTFQISLIDKITNQSTTQNFQISIEGAKLFCLFSNHLEIQDMRQDLNLNVIYKDLDENQYWNSDPDIYIVYECLDLVKSNKCRDQKNNEIQIIPNSYTQVVKKYSMKPLSIQQWKVTARKNGKISTITLNVAFLEEATQPLKVIFNKWYQIRPVSNYQKLNFTYDIPIPFRANLSSLSIGFVYDYSIVKILNPKFFENQFRIYDYFDKFNDQLKISLNFQAQYTHSITPSQYSLTVLVNEPPKCSKMNIASKDMKGYIFLKIGIQCLVSQFSPFKYKFAYFLFESDLKDYINSVTDFSLGFREYQQSNLLQTFIPYPFKKNSIYLLIQVVDQSGGMINIFEKYNSINRSIQCNVNRTNIVDVKFQVIQMFSALGNSNDSSCLNLAKSIYKNLTLNILQQQDNYIYLQAIKVYKKLIKIINSKGTQQQRILNGQETLGCFNTKDKLLQSSKLKKDTVYNNSKFNELKTNINFIDALLQQLIIQKNALQVALNQDQYNWDQEKVEQFQSTISLFFSIFHFIDDIAVYFTTQNSQDQELFLTIKHCQQMLQQVITEIENDVLIDDNTFYISGELINVKLQKQVPKDFLNYLHLESNLEEQLVRFYLKQQIKFQFNPLVFSKLENEKIQALLNSTYLTLDYQKYIVQNLTILTEFGKYIELLQTSQIQTLVTQYPNCNQSSIQDQLQSYSVHCVQRLTNQSYTMCQLVFKQNTNLTDVSCRCDKLGDVFLVFEQKSNLTEFEQNIDFDIFSNIFQISISNQHLQVQLAFVSVNLIICIILHKRDKAIAQSISAKGSDLDELSDGRQKLIYPRYFKLLKQNYKYLHNILSLFDYQADFITRSFNYLALALQIQTTFLFSIYFTLIIPEKFFYLRIVILIMINLIFRAFLKVCKGILRLNRILRLMQTTFLLSLIIMQSIITICITNYFNREIEALISFGISFGIYELIFDPILILARIHVYLIAISQNRENIFDKVTLMMYYFSWHWKLEKVMKQYVIV